MRRRGSTCAWWLRFPAHSCREEAFLRIAAFAHVLDPADSSLAAERLRGATRSFRGWIADAARRGGVRASWRAFYREFDALICPISPTAAFPHDHEPDHERRRLIVNGGRAALCRPAPVMAGRRDVARFAGDYGSSRTHSRRAADRRPDRRHPGSKTARRWSSRGSSSGSSADSYRRRPLPGPAAKPRSPRPVELVLGLDLEVARLVVAREVGLGDRMRPRFTAGRFESSLAARLTCL